MEIGYQRKFSHNYMWISGGDPVEASMDWKIVSENQIAGLLPVNREEQDGKQFLWYDITGKQALSDVLDRKTADSQFLEHFFFSFREVLDSLQGFLLEEENLLLEADQIYLDQAGEKPALVFCPMAERNLRQSFQGLMEFFLGKLDYSDGKAVTLAHELYQMSLQGEVGFTEMLQQAVGKEEASAVSGGTEEFLYVEYEAEIGEDREKILSEEKAVYGEKWPKSRSGENRDFPEKAFETRFSRRGEGHIEGRSKSEGLRGGILKEEALRGEGPRRDGLKGEGSRGKGLLGLRGLASFFGWEEEEKKAPFGEKELQQPKPVMAEAKTEVLTLEGGCQGVLRYQGRAKEPDFWIMQESFLIGKREGEVDGCIKEPTVSRIHARVRKEGDSFFLEDMNSSNGTWINEKRLEYRQKELLKPQDRIRFGEEEYLFF